MHVTCESCGKDFVRRHGEANRKYCNRDCYLAKRFPSPKSLNDLRTCKRCHEEKPLTDFEAHRGGFESKRGHERRHTCKICHRKQYRKSMVAANKKWLQKLKRDVLMGLGGKCGCCGESEMKFLTLHHIGGWGREHRMAYRGKSGQDRRIFTDVKRLGFPRDLFGVLCWNCHMADQFHGGCPHKEEIMR